MKAGLIAAGNICRVASKKSAFQSETSAFPESSVGFTIVNAEN